MRKKEYRFKKTISYSLAALMMVSSVGGFLPAGLGEGLILNAEAADTVSADNIKNDSLSVSIGDLGQISVMNIINNPTNSDGEDINFVLPNTERQQNNTAHQWMGEMIFSYRTSESEDFSEAGEFTEVDTNRTLAAGGSTTATNIAEDNPYIEKTVDEDSVEVQFKGLDADSDVARAMKGFDVTSTFDMATDDGSMLWTIEIENTSEDYIEFGDVGLPMPWNNKYSSIDDTYNASTTVHTFAGADSGYAYAIRCSGEGNYMLFTPVVESGARIEYIDQWIGSSSGGMNGVSGTRNGAEYANWTSDTGGWFPGLQVYYIHSKDIQKTGRGYYTDSTSLVLAPGESESYQFKFSAVRAGDNTPGDSAEHENNASDSVEERENNMRSILYKEGMIDAVAVPSFQTAINMPTELDLHYDSSKITDVKVTVQCVHENDPWDEAHIPEQDEGLVNNDKAIECAGIDKDSAKFIETKVVDGEEHHVYELNFCCIGNNSVRVDYKLDGKDKFTQFEFNVLEELDTTIEAHSDYMVDVTQDTDPESPTYGIYSDTYLSSGLDTKQKTHWGDDWSHDNINFMAMKNYLNPDPEEVESIEKYLIDFMWNNYMKYTQDTYTVANYLSGSGIYSDTSSPYTRTYSEVMEATGFFNMYRIQKAYPDLIDYRETPEWYLEKAYGIYYNRVSAYPIGFYGEQQIPDMIEALYAEGMTEEAENLKELFALDKGTNMATADYPYGSEFEYDNTGEEGAYAAAKSLIEYYPESDDLDAAISNMEMAEWKTRAMRGLQPTWYQYADPVFRGGETWWNFQYTASLAGSIMDDWLRYQDNGWDEDSSAWAERVNYAAKISNFNAVNMGQISDENIGAVSWRYTMAKGGQGAQNVNDGGTRVMNNGWNDFSGESEEGLYGSLLSISSDVATDAVFGLTGYGCSVSESGNVYTVAPLDGIGKRINIIDDKVYVESEQDAITKAEISADGTSFKLDMTCAITTEHVSKIVLSGAGVADGYYSINVNGEAAGQVYVADNEGTAYAVIPDGETANVTITKMDGGENTAPVIFKAAAEDEPQALVPFRVETSSYDDGALDGTLTYKWEVVKAPEGGELTLDADNRLYAEATATLEGTYTLKLTVGDGTLTTEKTVDITVGAAPAKTAPVIDKATATQHPSNTTVAELDASATADATYNNEVSYAWEVVEQPEGGNAVIANADQAEAMMKASAPGTYTLRVTVTDPKTTIYDEAMVTTKDVVIEMVGEVDGVERTSIVLTSTGEAPVLPETMTVINSDGTVTEETIVWDEIAEEAYAEAGEFVVYGTVDGKDMAVAAPVMVVAGKPSNLALKAVPTAIIDTPQDLGGVAGLNDGYDPANSRDKSHGVWHNWLGDNGAAAWVQYTWETAVTIYQSNAYYFTDGNFVPKEVSYEYLDANGEWRPMTNVVGLGTELNQYNETTFDPVTTTAIRMNMTPKTLGCGVIEWQVMGYAENVIDKVQLNRVIDSAESLNLNMFDLTDEDKEALQAEIDAAKAVYEDKEATQEEVDAAAARLARIVTTLPTVDGNLAYNATAQATNVSSWETITAVNDGRVPESSYGPTIPRHGTWGSESAEESITYTWNSDVTLTGTDIYFWHDGEEGKPVGEGGIDFPKNVTYQYLDAEGNWQTIATYAEDSIVYSGFTNTTFETPVTTTALKVVLEKQEYNYEGVGVIEWKVYGEVAAADTTALEEAIADAEALVADEYTEETWAAVAAALENAKAVAAEEKVSAAEINIALEALENAMAALEAKPDDKNIAPKATTDGVCSYDGVNTFYDQGGLPKLNDGIEPTSSSDLSNGAWFNWHDRDETPWVSYTWDAPVVLESTEIYYFTDHGGHQMPESVTVEYLNEAGEWVAIEAEFTTEADKYNTTELGNIVTTALRITFVPQQLISDPCNGVGIVEWKVNGFFAADTTALEEAIAEAETLNKDDYENSSWATLEAVLAEAKAIVAAGNASEEDVAAAIKAIENATNALVGKDETPVGENIAPLATVDGVCDYEGDLGGLAELNDELDPTDSNNGNWDAWQSEGKGTWHNWNHRYETPWVSYTWDAPVYIDYTDVYYFTDFGGILIPEAVSFEYLNEDGEWVPVEIAQNLSCTADEYNRIKLDVETTAIRMILDPQNLIDDPCNGVGVMEWKVYGEYVDVEIENPFVDVTEDDWFYEYVMFNYVCEIMKGTGDGTTFEPYKDITRAEVVQVLYNMTGETVTEEQLAAMSFPDVEADKWYVDAIAWAEAEGVVNGKGDGTFAPDEIVTREQLATMLMNFAEYAGVTLAEGADLSEYADAEDVSDWAVPYVEWAVAEGLITGRSTEGEVTLAPGASASRAEAATIFERFCINFLLEE